MTATQGWKLPAAGLIAAVFLFGVSAGVAQAFQVLTPDQLEDGLGARNNNYFSEFELDVPEDDLVRFSVRGGRGNGNPFDRSYRSEGPNWYGRSDGSGRYFGDNRNSNSQPCLGGQSNAAQLNSLNGGGYSYPCQRFR